MSEKSKDKTGRRAVSLTSPSEAIVVVFLAAAKKEKRCTLSNLVHLDVPLVVVLEALDKLVEVEALLRRDALQHVLDARHHALVG